MPRGPGNRYDFTSNSFTRSSRLPYAEDCPMYRFLLHPCRLLLPAPRLMAWKYSTSLLKICPATMPITAIILAGSLILAYTVISEVSRVILSLAFRIPTAEVSSVFQNTPLVGQIRLFLLSRRMASL